MSSLKRLMPSILLAALVAAPLVGCAEKQPADEVETLGTEVQETTGDANLPPDEAIAPAVTPAVPGPAVDAVNPAGVPPPAAMPMETPATTATLQQ